jgi:hypothetical protein
MDGQTDGWMDGRMDGEMRGCNEFPMQTISFVGFLQALELKAVTWWLGSAAYSHGPELEPFAETEYLNR